MKAQPALFAAGASCIARPVSMLWLLEQATVDLGPQAAVSNLWASRGHTENTLTLMTADELKERGGSERILRSFPHALRRCTNLCWAAFMAVLGWTSLA